MNSRYPEREEAVRERFNRLAPTLDERARRLFGANEAIQFGFGGLSAVQRATGLAKNTLKRGIAELLDLEHLAPPTGRQRKPGAGPKRLSEKDPGLLPALQELVAPVTHGDPERPLLHTSKSTETLARELTAAGHPVSGDTVLRLLPELGFTMQKTRKTLAGSHHEDRDAQFQHINQLTKRFQNADQPVVSVDTKKKELVGEYANGGREWHPKGEAPRVMDHDFPNGLPKAVPYGVYDIARNDGWVSVGVSGDTAEFATATIGRWWDHMGSPIYSGATDLLIIADCGGSNGYRVRLWKLQLQLLADRLGMAITVAHLPPATSKWNKIEHRMFSFISLNWRGRPLVSYETIVQLIGSTRTSKGLEIRCEIDEAEYVKGKKISDAELDAIVIERDKFPGEWNYTIFVIA